ncbi:hypothetical protein EB72_24800 [Mycobacterium sp. SWH-M1]|nr:hypothetical protein EB72_24800 [Mycobacterium sp. SWH-M1]
MPLAPEKVHVWETGDLYILPKTTTFVTATHIPANVDTALPAAWLSAGLLLGDPGIEMPRDIEETDINAWQLKRFRTKWKNGKVDGNATLLEDNDAVLDLLDPESVPTAQMRYLCMVFVDPDTAFTERRFTKMKAALFVENDNHAEENSGRPVRIRFYPDANRKLFTIQKTASV